MQPKLTLEQRFWEKVHVNQTGCWLWKASRDRRGYGKFNAPGSWLAHRFSWILHFGPIPPGLWVLHRCDVPRCVRPDHLFLGTLQDNVDDMISKGRGYTKLTDDDVREIRARREEGETFAQLAKSFNTCPSNIYRIVTRQTRANVD